MTSNFQIKQAVNDEQLQQIAILADTIWHEHFTSIIGTAQVEYMLDKFQSFPALKRQLTDGYEYYQIFDNTDFCGYCGIHPQDGKLFLSKLCSIWLTCNKHNDSSLAVYRHLGFQTIDTQNADIGNGFVMDDYIMECRI